MGLHLPGERREVYAGDMFLKDFAAGKTRVDSLEGFDRRGRLLEMGYRNLYGATLDL